MKIKSDVKRQEKVAPLNSLWGIVALSVLVFCAVLFSQFLAPEWRWKSPLWYANLNGVAGGLAVFLGSVLLLIFPFRGRNAYLVLTASAFIAAGLSGICGIFVNDASVSLWFENQAILLGGVFLSGLWLPQAFVSKHFASRRSVFASAGAALLLSGYFVVWGRELFPAGFEDQRVLISMSGLKFAGGALFLTALPRLVAKTPAPERTMLFTVALFLGLGGLSLPLTRMWGLDWWLAQIARYAPFLLAIRYALDTFTSSQRALFESEERFKALFNAAPVGIGIIDNRNNTYWQVNPELCRITGFTAEELTKTSLKSLIFPDDVYSAFELRNKLFRGELPDYCVTRKYLTKNGRAAWVKVRGTLIRSSEASAQEFRIVEDVTGEKVANDRVNTLVQELTRANAELVRFTSIASHDLRSPLNTVSNYVQLISRRLSEGADPDLLQLIKFAVDGCARMRNLIDDLLSYASVSKAAHRFETVDCNVILKEVLSNLDTELRESGAKIHSSSLPAVQGDKIQLTQLFQNLIGNAIKYRGGKSPVVEIKTEENETEWILSISDNGIGFDMEYAEKIFLEFQRLNSQAEYSGTGLGLPICKSIVSRHGGNIWVKSSPGVGSTFFITLRKSPEQSGSPPINVEGLEEGCHHSRGV